MRTVEPAAQDVAVNGLGEKAPPPPLRELRAQLEAFRKQGYAYNDSEDDEEIRSLAVPVFTSKGALIGAVSAVGTVNHVTDKKIGELVPLMRKAALGIGLAIEPFLK